MLTKIASGLNDAIAYQRALREDVPANSLSDGFALAVTCTALLVLIFAKVWG